jgi:hypothetical protein
MKKIVVAIAAGAVLGVVGSRVLFVGSWLSLIPWTIAGLALGAWCGRWESVRVGAVFGFSVSFVFMVSGYSGSAPLLGRLPAFAVLGVFGAVCGIVLGLLGSLIGSGLKRTAAKR